MIFNFIDALTYNLKVPCQLVLGNMGSGKTYTCASIAKFCDDIGKPCYHNIANLAAGVYLPSEKLKFNKLPDGSVYLCDEAGLDFNNRLWKNTDTAFIKIFKYLRHDKVSCIFLSQALDQDKIIRNLATYVYLQNKLLCFTVTTKWRKKIDPPTKENNKEDFIELYKRCSLLPAIVLRKKKIYKLYNSYDSFENDNRTKLIYNPIKAKYLFKKLKKA